MTLRITTLRIMTLRIMTLRIMTLRIMESSTALSVTIKKRYTQYYFILRVAIEPSMLSAILMSVVMLSVVAP